MREERDRRLSRRFPTRVFVDWEVPGSNTTIFSSTEDIGSGGMRIRTLTPPRTGSPVNVSIRRELQEKTFSLTGRVAWVRLDDGFCGMGLAFPKKEDQDPDLEDLMAELSQSVIGLTT